MLTGGSAYIQQAKRSGQLGMISFGCQAGKGADIVKVDIMVMFLWSRLTHGASISVSVNNVSIRRIDKGNMAQFQVTDVVEA
jgi:hypothetical protein